MLKLGDRDFEPQDPSRVTVYVCGPTVYAPPHIGNLRSAVNFDVLHRVLRRLYGEDAVQFVRNYTDVDDKIMEAARKNRVSIEIITTSAEGYYHDAVTKLHVLPPSATPRVTESMDSIRSFIWDLAANESAYESGGHVLFDRQKNPTFFLNDNIDPESLSSEGGASYKRHPHDFVLWKPSTGDQPGWDSPWGFGRPGWHIECSAMIQSLLGETIDIHCGGVDLKFPHHENECAQSHARNGVPLARYWVHNGMLDMDGKMSKSRGNIITMTEVETKFSPETLRYFFLTGHYRQPLAFSWERLEAAETSLKGLQRAMRMVGPMHSDYTYVGSLLDDLNTPRALAELHGLANSVTAHTANDDEIAKFIGLADVLGLHENYVVTITDEILEMQIARAEAREQRDFAKADQLRDVLIEMGVEVNDAPMRRM